MDWLVLFGIVAVVLAGISVLAYLRRIAAATERIADSLERAKAPETSASEVHDRGRD
ncbi:hypothetical protein [Humibacter sp. RRB41]|uniref:hypothetical protein n=1 Tax=Humibacter sp. RRB41 TaxID=2919946 RepID=UPI001FAA4CF0|nr:hypothetical protein [Humibacter sp. RRB41]